MDEVSRRAAVDHTNDGCQFFVLLKVHGECDVFLWVVSYSGEHLGRQRPGFGYILDCYASLFRFFVRFRGLMREFLLILMTYVGFVMYREFWV